MKYTIEHDDNEGCFMLLQDNVGMCKSKSRNVLLRVRDALNAVEDVGLVGLTVEEMVDSVPNRIYPRGVVLALAGNDLIVRLPDGKLDSWCVRDCRIVEVAAPVPATPWHDQAIGVIPAVELLQRFLACGVDTLGQELEDVARDTREFLAARDAAMGSP